ncbi:MAG TPA: MEDS domain-containing protein [Candidatus Eisenbacteria bacterium]|jgi:CheY-like chemotaxis protein|nr:MEDS domain-containing protein [Candidatus Eisenbacteria bacterium]
MTPSPMVALKSKHFVQFYRRDEALCAAVHADLRNALTEGASAAVLIATEAHARGFERNLRDSGLDVESLVARGRLTFLDAAATMARFMRDGEPDWDLFKETMIPALEKASGPERRNVWTYGEMVDLLWQEGRTAQALRLETFWNSLAAHHRFTLSCAYRFSDPCFAKNEGFEAICGEHSHSAAVEGYDGEIRGSVLLVEDDEDDRDFIRDVMESCFPSVELRHARNGSEATWMLRQPAAPPGMILLDLNMPLKDGRQVLGELRSDQRFDRTPVVVLTTSSLKSDERFVDCFRNAYFFTKPVGYRQYSSLVTSIVTRHLQIAPPPL